MPIIEVNHVTKEYQLGQIQSLKTNALNQWRRLTGQPVGERAPFRALDHVDFKIKEGEVLGIIDTNGAGKSILFKVLARIGVPTPGSLKVDVRIRTLLKTMSFAMLARSTDFNEWRLR